MRPVSSRGKRVGAEPAVKQNAEFVAIAGNAIERIERKPLEACDPIEPDPQFGCQILKLAAMVDREHRQILMHPPPRRRPTQAFERPCITHAERPVPPLVEKTSVQRLVGK